MFFDGIPVESRLISQLAVFCSIDERYPYAVVNVKDDGGDFLAKFQGLSIGSEIGIRVAETQKPETLQEVAEQANTVGAVTFTPFVIASIGEDPDQLANASGIIQILAVHPWFFYRDYSSHAYKGLPNSDIIKNVLKGSDRMWKFNFDTESRRKQFDESDEDGSIPRYKASQDDISFIEENLLPYTSIHGQPPLFWIDELNAPQFHSSASLFDQKSKAVAAVNNYTVIGEYSDAIKTLADDCGGVIYLFNALRIKIGDEDFNAFLPMIKPGVATDTNTYTGMSITAHFEPQVKISNRPCFLPIHQKVVTQPKTSLNVMANRLVKDSMAATRYSMKDFYQLFRVQISGDFIGEQILTGDCISLFFQAKDDKTHWLSDKWLVAGVKHYMTMANSSLQTTLTLCRPVFPENEKSSLETFLLAGTK